MRRKTSIHLTIDRETDLILMQLDDLDPSFFPSQFFRDAVKFYWGSNLSDAKKVSKIRDLEEQFEKKQKVVRRESAELAMLNNKIRSMKDEEMKRLKEADAQRKKMLVGQTQRIRKMKPLAQEALRRRRR